MTHIFEQKASPLNSKIGKKTNRFFYKTFAFIPACAEIKYDHQDSKVPNTKHQTPISCSYCR